MISAKELLEKYPKPPEPTLEEKVDSAMKYLEHYIIEAAKSGRFKTTPHFVYDINSPVTVGVIAALSKLGYVARYTNNADFHSGLIISW